MSGEGIDVDVLIKRVQGLAFRTGHFIKVDDHEPPSAPGKGVRGAIWVEDIDPIESGLDVVSVRVLLILRVSLDVATNDLGRIDPAITKAVNAFMAALTEDYTLGGAVREVDIHGSEGERWSADPGYFEADQGLKYRAVLVRIPCLLDDVWVIGGS